jgi:UDP-2,3-diacylglucosamine pyrophosphatase LpxH
MTTTRRIVVISDLHMGAPERALFTAKDHLAAFINTLTADATPVELVILGDAVDFLQIVPFLDFTVATATRKAREIVANHGEVFTALAAFVKKPAHTIRWFVGNHDIELLFGDVRKVFEAALGCASGDGQPLVWHLDGEGYNYDLPASGKIKPGKLRVRHGNSADPWNDIDYGAVQTIADRGGDAGFVYPPGSRLVAEVINPLKEKGFKHIDLLKPEVTVAMPLSLALWPEDTRAYLRAVFPAFFDAQAKGAVARIRNWATMARPTLGADDRATKASAPLTDADLLAMALCDIANVVDAKALPADEKPSAQEVSRAKDLAADLTRVLTDANDAKRAGAARTTTSTGRSVLGDGTFKTYVKSLLRDAAKRANDRSSPWAIDEPDDLYEAAQNTLSGATSDVRVLVAGHTHLARAMEFTDGYYFNTGTWADLMSLPRNLSEMAFGSHAASLLDCLREPEKAPWSLRAFRRLTYVEVTFTDDSEHAWRASLCEWPTGSPKVVHSAP